MHLDLPAIDVWEEVLPEIRGKCKRQHREADEPGDQLAAIEKTKLQQPEITPADGFEGVLETPLKSQQRIAAEPGRDGARIRNRAGMRRTCLKPLLTQQVIGQRGH